MDLCKYIYNISFLGLLKTNKTRVEPEITEHGYFDF